MSVDTCYNMDEPRKALCKVKEASHRRPPIMGSRLCKIFRTGKSTDTENRLSSGCLELGGAKECVWRGESGR